jgi:dTDP-4-dehydrorhamnose reductase
MKIFVLGCNGMLGRYVTSYFKKRYEVVAVGREIDASKESFTSLSVWFDINGIHINDVVINCIGLIKQKMTDKDSIKAIRINSIFPHLLSSFCSTKYVHLIHISTDCCFSGSKGCYSEEDTPDPEDMYGLSKAAGEPENCSVIRTSVIGEGDFKKSLIEWVKSQKEINAYINHKWNGVTCLQLTQEIDNIIKSGNYWRGVRHYFSDTVTKAQLVRMIGEVYGKDIVFSDCQAEKSVDRTLSTIYKGTFPRPKSIMEQLKEQRDVFA